VVVIVFDVGNLHVDGREGRGGGKAYTSKGLDRKGRKTGKERKGGEGKEREGSSLP